MKLQIDTKRKTITIESGINLGELFESLTLMFPKFAWKEYSIVPVKTIERWVDPILINQQPIFPAFPWVTPSPTTSPIPFQPPYTITCGPVATTIGNGEIGRAHV